MIRLRAGAHSDVGRVRAINQDAALVDEVFGLFAVADGMGGHLGGEVASVMALETLAAALREPAGGPGATLDAPAVIEAVEEANERVHDESLANDELRGMGTTLCAVAQLGEAGSGRLVVANVGDSRVYRLYQGELTQLTEDHSLVGDLVRQGRLTLDEAAAHPMRNVVTRVIGVETGVAVDWWERPAVHGERYLLCSDGLFNEVPEARIAATLRSLADPAAAARALVDQANEGGGRDNITCVVVDVADDDLGGVVPPDPGPTAAAALAADLATDPTPGTGIPAGTDPSATAGPPLRPRRFTGRVAVFLVVLVVLGGAVGLVLRSWERSRYVVRADGPSLVIYRGPDEKVLWFGPELVERTSVSVTELTDAQADRLRRYEATSLEEARRWLADLTASTTTVAAVTTTGPPSTAPGSTATPGGVPTTTPLPPVAAVPPGAVPSTTAPASGT